ncbi:ras guanine-nucleotide exchange protein-like protein [Mollisia scopiformis]|uniref:Ras guanine-nucleotide exchange protein-like protein n=1 Tax=Mollisia scopiformis TaxID=149040 RepID=A0A132B2C1_MOLSC|nr:ras guanine-nucleotide exchange protein-like protein [Mollisia scopiformis]KUJ06548.1 ras guanine-nucleotide exchange protein-like protein [Mollisia scopiformis]
MVTEKEHSLRSSIHVAPLSINKDRSRGASSASRHRRNTSSRSSSQTGTESTSGQSQMTPPATPNGSQEDLSQQIELAQPVFHNFLRAFYPFHPTYAVSDTTVTLPLNEGDVVLVHSVHTNGWADGTLLISGARGWLPTNYCEAYDPESMRNLLKALLNFWDLLRSGVISDSEVFGNQEFMRGIIAGVRYLLEKSNCLTRESHLIQSNEGLRRNRKALLSDLSALVKTAKRLQEYTSSVPPSHADSDEINNTIDEMILKAFKIVTRGVRFLDVLDDDLRTRQQQPIHRLMATVAEEAYNPPTPPADSTSFDGAQHGDPAYDAASRRSSSRSSGSGLSGSQRLDEQTKRQSYKRMETKHPSASSSRPLSSRPSSVHIKRQSISHRLSATIPAAQRQNLVSERLNSSHDTFLSHLGSFIGRLHLQSQSSADLISTVRQSVTAGQDLLKVVEVICAHDNQSAEVLDAARNAMYDRINQLVIAAREIITLSGIEDEDVVMPQQNGRLLMAATSCVKAAGECVAKTKFVIERIGDFEFEPQNEGLGIDIASIGAVTEEESKPSADIIEDSPPEPASRPPPPPLIIPSYEKPLPQVPLASPTPEDNFARLSPTALEPVAENATAEQQMMDSKQEARKSLLPPLPKMTSPLMTQEDYSPSEHSSAHDSEFQASFRSGSIAISNSGTSSTYLSGMRDSEQSMLSQTSTRATTPDISVYVPRTQPSISELSMTGSQSTLADDADDGESKMLEKTYAHELMHNKEGQITGGTLPALVERLTTHDSTPDSIFVSTFYLTFRLFVTPTELAKALVDRFDYVGESPHIAGPVRLRVYNVFKGWLESHWRDLSDHDALSIIQPFATEKLGRVLPGAGKRLLELSQKVSSTDGPLVPRLVSSMGKTSTSIAQYIPADTPLPPTGLSKSQMGALKNWKMGGSNPTILEFDPLELARQLTIKEMTIFCSIMPEELLGSEWTKRSGSNAVNVRAMSTLSTDLSNLVADTILQYDDAKKRAVIIKHWIKIAHKCLELNNYDSLMAIICSLNSSTIIRLKRTWDMVSQKRKDMLKGLQAIVEPDKNYAVLRRRLHDHVPPCLPFVGMYLTDLTFVDAGNAATRQLPGLGDSDGMSVINFDKHTRTAKIIGELQRFQIPYRLAEIAEMQEWLQAQIVRVKSSSENENVQQYYRKSLLLEPRENMHPRPSPINDPTGFSSTQKDKFDIFAWTHSRDRGNNVPATPI